MHRLLYPVVAWLALMLAGSALAQAAPEARSVMLNAQTSELALAGLSRYWLDEDGQASVDQVELLAANADGPFQLRHDGALHAIHEKALWLSFDAQSQDNAFRWLLEVGLPGVDRVSLYYRSPSGQWVRQDAGDSIAIRDWPLPDRLPVFALSTETYKPVHYLVRIEHARVAFSAPLRIYSHPALLAQRELEHMFLGTYFGLAMLVMVMALANALAYRESSFLAYAGYVGALAVAQLSYMGLAGQYLWNGTPWWTNAASFFLPAMAASVGLYFVRHVTNPGQYSHTLDRLTLAWVALTFVVALVDMLVPTRAGFLLGTIAMAGTLVLVYITIWWVWNRGDRYARWIALGFLPVMVTAPFPILRNFGVLPVNFWTAYSLAIGAAIETPLLLYAISRRSAQRREAQARAGALLQTDPLTGLTNHRMFLIRLHDALVRSQRFRMQCAVLVVDLSNHEWFRKEHGREVAERALVLGASRMRAVTRDVDTAARVGDTQLALLIEGPANAATAVSAATHVVARGLRPSDILPVGSTLKFHVAVALLPDPAHDHGQDAQAYLEWLSKEAAAMAHEPRKSIRTLNF